jgi:ELWxxDGT repeat protein
MNHRETASLPTIACRTAVSTAVLLGALFLGRPAHAVPATLVADLVTTVQPGSDSSPAAFTELGGVAYFYADDGQHGRELWRTDGTTLGTTRVLDLCPGSCGFDGTVTRVGDRLFLIGDDGAGLTVFVSDGTAAGTHLLRRLPGVHSTLQQTTPVEFAGRLWFVVYEDTIPRHARLWQSDGTTAGTTHFDPPGCETCDVQLAPLLAVGGRLIFAAGGPPDNAPWSLWSSDGTAAGTQRLPCGGSCVGVSAYQALTVGDRLYFVGVDGPHGYELWTLGPTDSYARLVWDLVPGPGSSYPSNFAVAGDWLYFQALSTENTPSVRWYRTQGNSIEDAVAVEPYGTQHEPWRLIPALDQIFMPIGTDTGNVELWTSGPDATPARKLATDQGFTYAGTLGGTTVWLAATRDGARLWTSDGTVAGTHDLGIVPGTFWLSFGAPFTLGNSLLLSISATTGNEPWITDGTLAGTHLLRDIAARTSSSPRNLSPAGDRLYFRAGTGFGSLVVASGTPPAASEPGVGDVLEVAAAGMKGYAVRQSDGELVAIDATGAVTALAGGGLDLHDLTPCRDQLAFAGGSRQGQPLWLTDGTTAGTHQVLDLNPTWSVFCPFECPYTPPAYPGSLTPVGASLFFVALPTGNSGEQLFVSDGTAVGTVPLLPAVTGTAARFLSPPVALRGGVATVADGSSLWVADSTAAHTTTLALATTDALRLLGTVGDRLLLVRHPLTGAEQIWQSDGTSAGTNLLAALPGPAPGTRVTSGATSPPSPFAYPQIEASVVVGGRLFFTAVDEVAGEEPWVSDGTATGTHRLADVHPGPQGSHPGAFSSYRQCALFAASDGTSGDELWASDGVTAWQVTDVAAGADSSTPGKVALAGGWLYFAADDGPHGRELFAVPATALDARCSGLPSDPPPPVGDWLSSPSLSGFAVKVQLGAGSDARSGSLAPCIGDALCAVEQPGDHREVMVRVRASATGGKPAIAKLTPRETQVWIQQVATTQVRYYHLAPTADTDSVLHGVLDASGFPASALVVEAPARAGGGQWLTPPSLPGYRFRVQWVDAQGRAQAGRASSCPSAALCLATDTKGRADIVVRLLDGGAAGRWPAIARLTTSAVEVWVQQVRSGAVRHYVLPAVAPGSTALDGWLDHDGFH